MKTLKSLFFFIIMAMSALCFTNCSSDSDDGGQENGKPEPPVVETFAKGADVSWLTEMESEGRKFYDRNGVQKECMTVLKGLGVNAIRLRVWVNPADGWCGKADVLTKALRAKELGLRLMIDFHYSDSWADPGKQPVPAAWAGYGLEQLKEAVTAHTKDVLQTLKANGVSVEWVQVGNETNQGMLWDVGFVKDQQFANFAQLVNSGYDAVKAVYPDAKVIVHTSNGHDLNLFTWMYDGLRKNGAKYDVIGMSLYPEDTTWEAMTSSCLANMKTLIGRYGKEVMVCEVGMPWDSKNAFAFMKRLVTGAKATDKCLGVFYWEPQSYRKWRGYTKGAFDDTGKPTAALTVFK